jgi:hypothetical protein
MGQLAFPAAGQNDEPQALGAARWDWSDVRRVLVVRLRSIGDTVLATPSLFALRRFLPHAEIDILLEDWVVPVFTGSDLIDRVIDLPRASKSGRARVARQVRANRYDVVYNLHGGTTATFLTRATGAKHRVGFAHYQYARLHNHVVSGDLAAADVAFRRATARFDRMDRGARHRSATHAPGGDRRGAWFSQRQASPNWL